MESKPSERAWELFDRLVELPAKDRQPEIEAACGDDAALRREVERLLELDERLEADDATFLVSPMLRPKLPDTFPDRFSAAIAAQARLPERVGRYRVVGLLGEGGMGAVYEAIQDHPHRSVALKVVRQGLLSPGIIRRFVQEAELLGRLQHPGIARIYDAGVDDDGHPYLAMELIRGQPLNEYSRTQALSVRDRLALMAKVCDAVQHAHEQRVIHRDLKPANILVEDSGSPKVLDFGVARATDSDRISHSGLTQTGHFLGTPSYMSPEQISGTSAVVDRMTDVYALGVILYELLSHRLPYRFDGLSLAEMARTIHDEDPPPLGSLESGLRGDVETIVRKTLEKVPSRRYQSAGELAADIRRWLSNEPILARPPSAIYQMGKFTRRHKGLVIGAAGTLVSLVVGLAGTSVFAVREAVQRRQSEKIADEASYQGYRARLGAAASALSAYDVASAAQHLSETPAHLRGWEWRHLQSRLDDSVTMYPLAPGRDYRLIATPDGLRVYFQEGEGIRLTDLSSGRSRPAPIPASRLGGARHTLRGVRIAAWQGNGRLDVLDETGRRLCSIENQTLGLPTIVEFSRDGRLLARPLHDAPSISVSVHEAETGRLVSTCESHTGGIWCLAFSPDGTRIATGGDDNIARVSDVATGRLLAVCQGHTSKILDVSFSPDGARLATSSSDGTVRQWDPDTGKEIEPPYDRHTGEVAAATYSPDGLRIASAGTDRAVRVWQAAGREDSAVLLGHTGSINGLEFSSDGRILSSMSTPGIFGWAGDSTLRTWDVDSGATLPTLRGHTSYVYPVAFSPDGRHFASGAWDRTVRIWDASTGETSATLEHPGIVTSLAYGPDGAWLVSGNYGDMVLRIWDTATARVVRQIPFGDQMFRSVLVSPDGRRIVTTTGVLDDLGSRVRIYDLESSQFVHDREGKALAFSPDGGRLAIMDRDTRSIHILDARTFRTLKRLEGHAKLVFSARFSPDGRTIASCSQDRTVRLWDTETGDGRILEGHSDEVFGVAFHPDGTRLATGGRDRSVRLWDVARGEELVRLPGHTSYIWSLAFSPDGKTLVSGSGDFSVRLWDTAPLRVRYQTRRGAAASRRASKPTAGGVSRE